MTYHERKVQLINTISSLHQYKGRDVVIIVVDDGSVEEPASELLLESGMFPANVLYVKNKTWVNPCVPFNMGFEVAMEYKPDIILIQNAECYHRGDIIAHAEKNLTESNYISYGCYSLPKDSLIPPAEIKQKGASHDGDDAWYNHPAHRPVGYHFCSAITAGNLRKLNGFDDRYAYGIGYDDVDFISRVRNMGLRVEITDDPFVYHQWHYASKNNSPFLIKKNADLYSELGGTGRAKHFITADL